MNTKERTEMLSVNFVTTVGGIYLCFMACSLLHERLYQAAAPDGVTLSPWVVNSLESFLNALVGLTGMCCFEGFHHVPQGGLALTGGLQVLSKYCGSSSRVHGVPGPVLTLVKSARPLPVMIGQRVIAGTTYTVQEYVQYLLIVFASILVGTTRSSKRTDAASFPGLLLLFVSIVCDGFIGGKQKELQGRVKAHRKDKGMKVEHLQPFEMQFYTNAYMCLTAVICTLACGDFPTSISYVKQVPSALESILQYTLCSALGQVFIFRCVSDFDPLVLSVVTTSRKLLSVLLTLLLFGYEVGPLCILGLVLAGVGFTLIAYGEVRRHRSKILNTALGLGGKGQSE